MSVFDMLEEPDREITDYSDERMKICRECPLYKKTAAFEVCNSELYISETDKQTVSDKPKTGFRRGCGCVLTKKVARPDARCIVGKW